MIQHHFYLRNFTRFLCLVIANLPEIEDVRTLMRNLLEELGVDERLGETHAELFLLAMRTVGATTQGKSPLNGTQQLWRAGAALLLRALWRRRCAGSDTSTHHR